jgi:hypothetical protein
MLDERSRREAVENQIKACPNCARIQNIRDQAEDRRRELPQHLTNMHALSMPENANDFPVARATKKMRHSTAPLFASEREPSSRSTEKISTPQSTSGKKPNQLSFQSPSEQEPISESPQLLISPMTTEILGRQNHTRHSSMDFPGNSNNYPGMHLPHNSSANAQRLRNFSMDVPATVDEGEQTKDGVPPRPPNQSSSGIHVADPSIGTPLTGSGNSSDASSTDSSYSRESVKDAVEEEYSGVKNAKYIFLTLREALINSMVIIAFGCLGFCLIEEFSVVDSWYFTTVLLTTVVSSVEQKWRYMVFFHSPHIVLVFVDYISGIRRYHPRNR